MILSDLINKYMEDSKKQPRNWYTNGRKERLLCSNDQPEGWRLGRSPKIRKGVTARQFAKAKGKRTYIGKKCPSGHIGRYVSTGACVECLRSSYDLASRQAQGSS